MSEKGSEAVFDVRLVLAVEEEERRACRLTEPRLSDWKRRLLVGVSLCVRRAGDARR